MRTVYWSTVAGLSAIWMTRCSRYANSDIVTWVEETLFYP